MDERRSDIRKLVNTPVRLYHSELGRIDGMINDISGGGAAIKLKSHKVLDDGSDGCNLLLRPINLDVLFPVSFLRQTESNVVVRFLE